MFRVGWMGFAIVLSVLAWNFWMPSIFSLKLGLLAFLTLLYWMPQDRWASLVILCMFFLLGSLRISTMVVPPMNESEHQSIVWVKGQIGQRWLLEGKKERWWAELPYQSPVHIGELVAIQHFPQAHVVELPGGTSLLAQQMRGRVQITKVKNIETILQREPLEQPEIFQKLSQGDILWALVSGQRQIDAQIKQLLQNTGTSHLLAISGMHIALLAGMVFFLSKCFFFWLKYRNLNLRIPLLCAVGAGIFYGAQVGWPASAQRAVLMLSIFSFGKWWEWDFSLWDVLGGAAGAMVLREPMYVNDLGFQLSFSAVMGIAYFMPMLQNWIETMHFSSVTKWLLLSIAVSFGATMGTLPISALIFQQIPWVGLLSNIFVGPLVGGIATPLAMMAFVGQGTWAEYGLDIANGCIELSLGILRLLEVNPWQVAWNLEKSWIVAAVILLLGIGAIWFRILNGLLLLGLCAWHSPFWEHAPTTFEVHFLDIGQGDGSLLRWPDGTDWLIDGGPKSWNVSNYLKRLGVWKLQKVVISHAHPDHFAAIHQVIEQVQVEAILLGRLPNSQEHDYEQLLQKAMALGIRIEILGQDFWGDPIHQVQVWHPQNQWKSRSRDWVNEESIVLQVDYGRHSWLFTGDIEKEAETLLSGKLTAIDVLKVAHHGSKTSSMRQFIEIVNPKLAVIQCGYQNRFGHPHSQTLWSLRGSILLRTDELGTIVMQSDGAIGKIFTSRKLLHVF